MAGWSRYLRFGLAQRARGVCLPRGGAARVVGEREARAAVTAPFFLCGGVLPVALQVVHDPDHKGDGNVEESGDLIERERPVGVRTKNVLALDGRAFF